MAGFVPPPGFYVQNDLYFYNGSVGGERIFATGRRLLVDVESGRRPICSREPGFSPAMFSAAASPSA